MGKTKSVYVSDENAEYLEEHPNASDLVDDLLDQYREGGTPSDVAKQLQLRQARQKLNSLEAQTEHQREFVEEIESDLSQQNQAAVDEINELIDDMQKFETSISPKAKRVERIATEHFSGSVTDTMTAIKERIDERDDVTEAIIND